jgi:hypothetical protein
MRRQKLLLSIVLAVLGALVVSGVAAAKYTSGVYRMKPPTSHSKYVDLSFTATRTRIRHLWYVVDGLGRCSNGQPFTDTEEGYAYGTIKIQSGRFTASGSFHSSTTTLTSTISGKLTGHTATGTLRVRGTFNGGSVSCDTRPVRWKAYKLG